jgi:hypothetical protein
LNEFIGTVFLVLPVLSGERANAGTVQNFLYISSGDLRQADAIIRRPDIAGVKVVYNLRVLEKNKGQYDFSRIKQDIAYPSALNKKLFIQIQDRFFEPQARNIPNYLLQDAMYRIKAALHRKATTPPRK